MRYVSSFVLKFSLLFAVAALVPFSADARTQAKSIGKSSRSIEDQITYINKYSERFDQGRHLGWLKKKWCQHKKHKDHKWCKPSEVPPPEQCRGSEPYTVTYTAFQGKHWPFQGGHCKRNEFRKFHVANYGVWVNGSYLFYGINVDELKLIQLEKETVIMTAIVDDLNDLNLKSIRISLNGFQGQPISSDAVSVKTISRVEVHGDNKHRWGKKDRGDNFDEGYLVEMSFHLEKFAFRVNYSASDIIRLSKILSFKVTPARKVLRSADVKLILEGVKPANCNPPPSEENPPVATITSTSVGSLTNLNAVSISFVSDVPANFQCSLDGSAYVDCTSPYVNSQLSDGLHRFSVIAINQGGTSQPAFFDWTIDTTAPVVSIDSVSPSESLTTATQISIGFSASEMATFQCRLDSAQWSNCSSPFTQSNLSDGVHNFAVRATDAAGNSSAEASYQWTIKTVPPIVQITSVVPSNNPSNANTRTYTFTASADAVGFRCSLDGGAQTSCTSPYSLVSLADGGHIFEVRAVDSLGNVSAPATESFTIDTVAPQVNIVGTIPAQSPTNSSTIQISFTSDEAASFVCSLDGLTSVSCNSPMSLGALNDGSHHFEVIGTDPAGNASSPAVYNWTVDTTAPVLSITSVDPATPFINQSLITINFSVSESATVACDLDGVVQDCSAGSVSYSNLIDGSHMITMTPRDMAGNFGFPVGYTFTVDTSSPVVSITSVNPNSSPTQSASIALAFTSSDAVLFRCQIDGGAFEDCTSPKSYSNLTDGLHNFNVIGVDAAGNVSASPASYSWTIDTIAPSIQITSSDPASSPTRLQSMTLSFASDEPGTFQCQLDNLLWASCSSPTNYNGLADGVHTFRVYATDLAGNNSATSAVYTWTTDSTAPVTTITSTTVVESPTEATNISISFSANEAATFQCRLDGGSFSSCMSPISYSNLTPGAHVFEVRGTDLAGNIDTVGATFSWSILSTPLVLTSIQISQISRTSARIAWTSNIPSTTQVAYSPGTSTYTFTPVDSTLTTNHVVILNNLSPNTFYIVYGISTDGMSQTVNTNTGNFRTLR